MKKEYIRLKYDWSDFDDLEGLLPEGFSLLREDSDYKTVILCKDGRKYQCASLGDYLRIDKIF